MSNHRHHTTFNQCDTSVCTNFRGRIQINHGVEQRCNQVIRILTAEFAVDKSEKDISGFDKGIWGSMSAEYILNKMRELPGGHTYRHSDINYALQKLKRMGLVKVAWKDNHTLRNFWMLTHPPDQVTIRLKQKKAA